MRRRKGEGSESTDHHVRSDRLLETSDGWYFRTREGVEVGPYQSKFDAQLCASLLITRLAQLEPGVDYVPHIRAFMADPAHAPRNPALSEPKKVDLKALKENNRRKRKREACRKAWGTVVDVVRGGLREAMDTKIGRKRPARLERSA